MLSKVPPMKCKKHLMPECIECKEQLRRKNIGWQNPKPHGPVSEWFMRHFYGAKR